MKLPRSHRPPRSHTQRAEATAREDGDGESASRSARRAAWSPLGSRAALLSAWSATVWRSRPPADAWSRANPRSLRRAFRAPSTPRCDPRRAGAGTRHRSRTARGASAARSRARAGGSDRPRERRRGLLLSVEPLRPHAVLPHTNTGRHQGRMVTRVRKGTRAKSSSMCAFSSAMHPAVQSVEDPPPCRKMSPPSLVC